MKTVPILSLLLLSQTQGLTVVPRSSQQAAQMKQRERNAIENFDEGVSSKTHTVFEGNKKKVVMKGDNCGDCKKKDDSPPGKPHPEVHFDNSYGHPGYDRKSLNVDIADVKIRSIK